MSDQILSLFGNTTLLWAIVATAVALALMVKAIWNLNRRHEVSVDHLASYEVERLHDALLLCRNAEAGDMLIMGVREMSNSDLYCPGYYPDREFLVVGDDVNGIRVKNYRDKVITLSYRQVADCRFQVRRRKCDDAGGGAFSLGRPESERRMAGIN